MVRYSTVHISIMEDARLSILALEIIELTREYRYSAYICFFFLLFCLFFIVHKIGGTVQYTRAVRAIRKMNGSRLLFKDGVGGGANPS